MNSILAAATDFKTARSLGRQAIYAAVAALILTGMTVPGQMGLVSPHSLWYAVFVGLAVLAATSWVWALLLISRSRGYHALFGLLLILPFCIIFYHRIFPDRFKA